MSHAEPGSRPLAGRVAVVTGAGRGIGRSIALALAEAGASVALAARSQAEIAAVRAKIAAVQAEIASPGARAIAVPTDITAEDDVARLFARTAEELGPADILVNNAGIGAFGQLESLRREDLDSVLAVNVRGTFFCCREAVRMMKPRKRGAIINISSVVGFRGYADQSAYAASKHAVMGLTKCLAVEAQAHGIRVSAILPGGVDTDLIRKARPDIDPSEMLQPEDVARCVMFLLTLPERAAIDEIYLRRRSSTPW